MHIINAIRIITVFVNVCSFNFEYSPDLYGSERIDIGVLNGIDVSNANGFDVSHVNGYDLLNGNENDVPNYNGNGVSWDDSNTTELTVPCVNISRNKTACLCSEDGTLTDCSRRNLTFVPKVPPETITLNMSGNSLISLDQDSLTNISTLSKSLKSLDVSKNQISYVENGSLSDYTALQNLNVSANLISNTAIENLTTGISSQLENLMLEGLKMKTFPYNTMPHLNNTRLLTLSVKNNSIKNVSTTDVFPFLKKLKHLDLSFNSIREISIGSSESLETLSLSSNELTRVPHFCRDRVTLSKILWIFLDDNCIRQLRTERLDCLDTLQLLNISATRIQSIPSNAFSGFKSLEILTLEKTESLSRIESYAFNSSTLNKVYIRFNRLLFNRRQVGINTILRFCPSLQRLDLSGNYLTMMRNSDWTDLLEHVGRLMWLDISNSGILFLPSAIPKYLHRLQDLHVSNTAIHFIPKDYFVPLTALRVLFLNGNKFTTITAQDFPPSFANHLYFINVAFNPFVCNCDLLWFIEFTEANYYKMALYPKNYECSKGKWKQINHFKIDNKSCLLRNVTSIIIKCTCIATMFLMLIMSVVYRYRWRLRYMFYILNFRRRKCANNMNVPFVYDVYVSSADPDFNAVYYQIVMELENKGLKVYFPNRDATAGTMALRESLENMDSCKHVLLCLSNAYAQDSWCEFEACMALERTIYEDRDKNVIIVVVLEEICSVNVTKVIHKLTRTGDYLIWDENHATNTFFWRKLGQMIEML